MLSFAEFRGFIVLTLTSEALEAEGGGRDHFARRAVSPRLATLKAEETRFALSFQPLRNKLLTLTSEAQNISVFNGFSNCIELY